MWGWTDLVITVLSANDYNLYRLGVESPSYTVAMCIQSTCRNEPELLYLGQQSFSNVSPDMTLEKGASTPVLALTMVAFCNG